MRAIKGSGGVGVGIILSVFTPSMQRTSTSCFLRYFFGLSTVTLKGDVSFLVCSSIIRFLNADILEQELGLRKVFIVPVGTAKFVVPDASQAVHIEVVGIEQRISPCRVEAAHVLTIRFTWTGRAGPDVHRNMR
ncbi:hypothetical protein SUGI_0565740 [Cryptomeria japonica]|nr:hypothetical protein SUGI_0565740 [Cryptomeria japonica]